MLAVVLFVGDERTIQQGTKERKVRDIFLVDERYVNGNRLLTIYSSALQLRQKEVLAIH